MVNNLKCICLSMLAFKYEGHHHMTLTYHQSSFSFELKDLSSNLVLCIILLCAILVQFVEKNSEIKVNLI